MWGDNELRSLRSMKSSILSLPLVAILTVLLLGGVAIAEVSGRYAGRVILFDARPPRQWANDGVFHRFVSQHSVRGVEAGESGTWEFEYMAFFRRPVGDREVSVRFFDAMSSDDQYLASYTLYLGDPQQRIVGGQARLRPEDGFRPNRYYTITVASRGTTLARLDRFALVGDEPERSGEVVFTDEDTRGR
jgi:hypothetical protein